MRDPFFPLIGNERVKKKLLTSLSRGGSFHPLCFQGIDGIGKALFAKAYARALFAKNAPALLDQNIENFSHVDIIELHPTGKLGLHSIESIRLFCNEAFITPYLAKQKVLLLHEAERMHPPSANHLLKTLEEPGENVIIILLTSSFGELLPTIRSRVQTLYFEPLMAREIASYLISTKGLREEEAHALSSRAEGSLKDALRLSEEKESILHFMEPFLLKRSSYLDLKHFLNLLEDKVAERKTALEEKALREARAPFQKMELTAKQEGDIEKQVEGIVAMKMMQEAKALLKSILLFFRDLHGIYHGGQDFFPLLTHRHLASTMLEEASKEPLPLERVERIIRKALIALERSTPLPLCIENVFLQLNCV